jgi:hypothetical protein
MTVTTINPDATIGGSASSGTVHGAVSDTSDATYAYSAPSVQMSTFSLNGGVIKSMRAWARLQSVSGGNPILFQISLGDPFGNSFDSISATAYDTTINDYQGLFGPSFDNPLGQAHQTVLDNLRMSAAAYDSVTYAAVNDTTARFIKLYANITWVAKPIVSVNAVTPDPLPTSSIANISWSNTLDSDGGAQTRYHVRVFNTDQYGIGGFNPETSPATYDSGNLTGSGTSFTTVALPGRGQVYRAYVRVGQTVNGNSHYSDWSFDQFTTGGTPVSLPAGTRAPVTITGGQRAVITLPGGAKL